MMGLFCDVYGMMGASYRVYNDPLILLFFFFNDTATTEIYTLSLHDALPILLGERDPALFDGWFDQALANVADRREFAFATDRKSTRLNSSHSQISYAVFCLKKKNNVEHIAVHILQQEHDPRACFPHDTSLRA